MRAEFLIFFIKKNIWKLNKDFVYLYLYFYYIGKNIMKHLLYTPLIVVFLLIGCQDDPAPPKQKPTDQPQTPTSLEGTVWVHHPDTDTNGFNWFNLGQNPKHHSCNCPIGHKIQTEDIKITFGENDINDNIGVIGRNTFSKGSQIYLYGYEAPYIRIFRTYLPEGY